jgi:hypothetical protein
VYVSVHVCGCLLQEDDRGRIMQVTVQLLMPQAGYPVYSYPADKVALYNRVVQYSFPAR